MKEEILELMDQDVDIADIYAGKHGDVLQEYMQTMVDDAVIERRYHPDDDLCEIMEYIFSCLDSDRL